MKMFYGHVLNQPQRVFGIVHCSGHSICEWSNIATFCLNVTAELTDSD